MAGVNKVILIGNLGRDPEERQMDNGRSRTKFTLATSEFYRKEGERITQTTWHNIVCWSPIAEIASKFLKKGDAVYIEGKINNRSYQDATGTTKYITEIVAKEMTLLNNRHNRSGENLPSGSANSFSQTKESEDRKEEMAAGHNQQESAEDELPF